MSDIETDAGWLERRGKATDIERVQLGVRMEKKMVKVLKGLAEFEGITLGQLLEKIVIHSPRMKSTPSEGRTSR